MQDNEPLMRALAKLVTVNNPDKIVFVGEALVGNEAVDQLTKFDRSLKDFSSLGGASRQRGIDGIVLTKFDTIVSCCDRYLANSQDDKVGAALSMTYVTGQPILFVGCGQTYTDLRHLRVNHIVQALLSS
jgi:signal recognition particle receptor subunit alpha